MKDVRERSEDREPREERAREEDRKGGYPEDVRDIAHVYTEPFQLPERTRY